MRIAGLKGFVNIFHTVFDEFIFTLGANIHHLLSILLENSFTSLYCLFAYYDFLSLCYVQLLREHEDQGCDRNPD